MDRIFSDRNSNAANMGTELRTPAVPKKRGEKKKKKRRLYMATNGGHGNVARTRVHVGRDRVKRVRVRDYRSIGESRAREGERARGRHERERERERVCVRERTKRASRDRQESESERASE